MTLTNALTCLEQLPRLW